ncbi:MAG: phosphohydrolase [Firmicutes bacterium HGW-Firmicutes-7]|nr:MAG: phosphohydrolase [Firmicutes bacterium HGW-Firmicutes-7]
MKQIGELVSEMINYYSGDIKRINHFIKVYGFAKAIGENEKIETTKQNILEVAALVHDIGIKVSELKYNSSAGKYQELEGPMEATHLLERLGYSEKVIERVCFLIANHHTYSNIQELDHQILVESDFLVNIAEEEIPEDRIIRIKEKIFKTKTGHLYLDRLYL